MSEPVLVETDIHNSVIAAKRLMPDFSRNDVFYRSFAKDRRPTTNDWSAHVHIEIEDHFPHRSKKYQVPLLSGVFLRHLQLDCLTGVRHCAKQRRRRLAHLEINGPILDLNHDIVFELPV